MCSKGQGADCGKTLYWRIGVAYLASEITSGLPVSHSWPTPGRMAAFESQKRAIPLKTAVFACARASQYGVTIKRDGHICRSSPHEAGGGTRTQVLTEFLGERQVSKAENSQHTPEGVYMPCLVAGDGGGTGEK